ncbi:hypothetical protein DRN34_02875 [Thermococci archaeon]|nr:MAG: hypothetical protein DRN34_02875 [Thermococci archaeon]
MFRKIGYKKAISDAGWVSEIIIERFDAAFELLSINSVVYGGAVRDALAGMPLEGDLDVSIPPNEFGGVHQAFASSVRWKPVSTDTRLAKPPGKYGKRHMPVISSIVEYEGINGARAQLICSNDVKSSAKESALYIPRNVDIICCGVVIDKNGIVYEVVEGAYDDCKAGVLRLNKSMENPHTESLKERAAKLEKRGWVNKLDMRKAARLERKKKAKSPRLKKQKKIPNSATIIDEGRKNKHRAYAKMAQSENQEVKWSETGRWPEDVVVAVDPSTMPDRNYIAAAAREMVAEENNAPDDARSSDEMRQKYGVTNKKAWIKQFVSSMSDKEVK